MHHGIAPIIKEPPERELKERMFRVLAILMLCFQLPHLVFVTVLQTIRVDGVKVGGVGGTDDLGDVGSCLLPQPVQDNVPEEGVVLDFMGASPPQAILGITTQPLDQVFGLGREAVIGNLQGFFPVDHLQGQSMIWLSCLPLN